MYVRQLLISIRFLHKRLYEITLVRSGTKCQIDSSLPESFCKTPQLLNFVERILSYKWIWSQRKDSNNQCMTITLNKKIETVDFLNKLYANALIYLDRKYERYLEVINEL